MQTPAAGGSWAEDSTPGLLNPRSDQSIFHATGDYLSTVHLECISLSPSSLPPAESTITAHLGH